MKTACAIEARRNIFTIGNDKEMNYMTNGNGKKPNEFVNRVILVLILLSVTIGILLYVLSILHFDLISGGIAAIMAMAHLGLLLSMKNRVYVIPLGFYLCVAITFFCKYGGLSPILPAVAAVIFFILFLYVLITRKFA